MAETVENKKPVNLGRNLGWVSISLFLATLLGIVKMGIAARLMSASDIGVYALLLIYFQLGGRFGALGLSTALIHFDDLDHRKLNTVLVLNLSGTLIFVLLVSGIFWVWESGEFLIWLLLLSLSLLLRQPAEHYRMLRIRAHEHGFNARVQVLSGLIGEGFSIFGLLLGYGLAALVLGQVVHAALYFAGHWVLSRKRFPRPNIQLAALSEMRLVFRYAGWQFADSIVASMTERIDRLLIQFGFGLQVLGAYELAAQLMNKPFQLIGSVLTPLFAPIYSDRKGDIGSINRLYLSTQELSQFIFVPLYLFLSWQAEALTRLIYGEGWEITALSIQAIALLGLARAMISPIGSYLIGIGKPEGSLWINLGSLLVFGLCLGVGILLDDYKLGIWLFATLGGVAALAMDAWVRWSFSRMNSFGTYARLLRSAGLCLLLIFILQHLQAAFSGFSGWIILIINGIALLGPYLFLSRYWMDMDGLIKKLKNA